MWNEVNETLQAALRAHKGVRLKVAALETQVSAGKTTPSAAAHQLVAAFLKVSS